ncbi:alpha/beta fold hydrolase [Mycobacterium decipiens]|uniref:Alpha/beta hydrolase n=1 Tax=Mycobacterium decipiens TaxID=1430326 RepID=A0A1X2LTW9_9MYCO|nr:alpha/beta hydrolase [Mycobacterium decipiens]OSC40314.1 alpha/beta hydrolase [Mycobacterium decipiens]
MNDAAGPHVVTPDRRVLTYLEVGDPAGPLVIHNHGGPSSRLEAKLFAAAAGRQGLRFVCVDRPGIGGSTAQPGRGYADWGGDLIAIADALGHSEFGVTGWSEGGPWALAAAAYVDADRLRHVTNIAGGCYGAFGDNWAADHLSKADALGGTLALRFRPGFKAMYAGIGITAKHFRGSFAGQLRKSVNDYDRDVLADQAVMDGMLDAFAECFAHGSNGLVVDAELLYHRWAFDVTAIERPVHVWQGTGDTLVPPYINRTIADRMPGAVWHEVPDAGHFVGIGAADDILAVTAGDLRA